MGGLWLLDPLVAEIRALNVQEDIMNCCRTCIVGTLESLAICFFASAIYPFWRMTSLYEPKVEESFLRNFKAIGCLGEGLGGD